MDVPFEQVDVGSRIMYEGVRYRKMALVNRKIQSNQPWRHGARPPATYKRVNAQAEVSGRYALFAPEDVVSIIYEE